jgi:hypothetical protein
LSVESPRVRLMFGTDEKNIQQMFANESWLRMDILIVKSPRVENCEQGVMGLSEMRPRLYCERNRGSQIIGQCDYWGM